jgi:hypothetical protein
MFTTRILFVAAGLTVLVASATSAQLPRRSDGAAATPTNRAALPANPRFPFAGSWDGTLMHGERARPISFDFAVVDGQYSGTTIWPNDSRAPHTNVRVVGDALQWEMPNSGGGTWYYQAKRVSADSIAGTMELRGAPHINAPIGNFVLVRKTAQQRSR